MSRENIRLGTAYRSELVKFLSLPTTGKMLDVGCLDGYILEIMSGDYKVGVDRWPIPNKRVKIVQADACYLPFPDNFFDFISAFDVIEHVLDDRAFVLSLFRVLKPNGRITITTPSRFIRMTPFFLTNYISRKWGHTFRKGYSKDDLSALFLGCQIDLKIRYFSASNYRRFYFIARGLSALGIPGIANWIQWMARQDWQKPENENGFVILDGWKAKQRAHE